MKHKEKLILDFYIRRFKKGYRINELAILYSKQQKTITRTGMYYKIKRYIGAEEYNRVVDKFKVKNNVL